MAANNNINRIFNDKLIDELNNNLNNVYLGGGEKAAAKHKAKGKMLARERVAYLIDTDKPWLEIGALAADNMYAEHGGCPSAFA